MKLLCAARMCRPDLNTAMHRLAGYITKWCGECDRRLERLYAYVLGSRGLHHRNLTLKWKSLKTLRKTSFWNISAANSLASPHIVRPNHTSFPGTVSLYHLIQFYIFMQKREISLMVAGYPEIF